MKRGEAATQQSPLQSPAAPGRLQSRTAFWKVNVAFVQDSNGCFSGAGAGWEPEVGLSAPTVHPLAHLCVGGGGLGLIFTKLTYCGSMRFPQGCLWCHFYLELQGGKHINWAEAGQPHTLRSRLWGLLFTDRMGTKPIGAQNKEASRRLQRLETRGLEYVSWGGGWETLRLPPPPARRLYLGSRPGWASPPLPSPPTVEVRHG